MRALSGIESISIRGCQPGTESGSWFKHWGTADANPNSSSGDGFGNELAADWAIWGGVYIPAVVN